MRALQFLLTLAVVLTLAGCEVIATIFEAGVWVGVIAVLVVIGLIVFIISTFRR
jgi:hypothetical protein